MAGETAIAARGKAGGYEGHRRIGCQRRSAAMLTQAAGLAVLAALSPTAVLVCAVLLGTANPHRTVIIYVAGAIVITVIFAAIVFVVLRAGHLQRPQERDPGMACGSAWAWRCC